MWHLIKKDIKLCQWGLFLFLTVHFFLGFSGFIFIEVLTLDPIITIFGLIFLLFSGISLTSLISLANEEKVKGKIILYSLPIDRELVITSRYVSAALLPLVQAFVYFLFSFMRITAVGQGQPISIFAIMAALTLVFFVLSINLYNFFNKEPKKEEKNKTIVDVITYISFLVLLMIFSRWEAIGGHKILGYLDRVGNNTYIIIGFTLSIAAYIYSWQKTKKNLG